MMQAVVQYLLAPPPEYLGPLDLTALALLACVFAGALWRSHIRSARVRK